MLLLRLGRPEQGPNGTRHASTPSRTDGRYERGSARSDIQRRKCLQRPERVSNAVVSRPVDEQRPDATEAKANLQNHRNLALTLDFLLIRSAGWAPLLKDNRVLVISIDTLQLHLAATSATGAINLHTHGYDGSEALPTPARRGQLQPLGNSAPKVGIVPVGGICLIDRPKSCQTYPEPACRYPPITEEQHLS
jgi:hypothetical protein